MDTLNAFHHANPHAKKRLGLMARKMDQDEEERFQTTIPKEPPPRPDTVFKKVDHHRPPPPPLRPHDSNITDLRQPRQHKQKQKHHRPGTTKIHVVTDEEVPRTMVDKERNRVYTTMHFLGEGGFARCYQVRDQEGTTYAAKVVAKQALEQEKYRTKLQSEIVTHGLMKHPRIVRFHSYFEDERNVYLILELCDNKTLAEMLKTRRHFTEPEARYYMIQLLDACAYMHEQQVVHRDIKLSNIFLDHSMNVKLGDFGLSAMLKSQEDRKRTVCGTPNYMAPEILFGDHRHNQRADIWSLGILMYTLLTGQHPFQMKSYNSIYQKIRDNSHRPTYTYPENIPLSLEAKDLISKLLVNDPDIRLSISNVLQHPFIQHRHLPVNIPLAALTGRPILQYLPLINDSLSPDRKLVITMVASLQQALTNTTKHHKGRPIQPIVWTRHNAFIDRWIDYTAKYGLGYSISGGDMAVLFNDATTLSTMDQKTHRFIDQGTLQTYQHTPPSHLRRKHHLLASFYHYMNAKLATTIETNHHHQEGIYLVKYIVTDEAVIFRLSNNVIQFNFFSRPKLMFLDCGKRILYVDRAKQVVMYEVADAVATGDPELLSLLNLAKDTLQSQLSPLD